MTAPAGIKFGHFTLGKRLARGGMAEVFLARQRGPEGFDRRVAVKRILPHLAEAPDFVKMFLSEARLAARLTHPNIVHIYELGQVDGDYFIAMEYVDGVHAGQLLTETAADRLPPSLIARLGADAAGALAYAHRLEDADGQPLQLVHRDVSPHNLMISYDGVTKLVDFGIAKAASKADETQPGVVKGKYAYMSPEQTVGRALDGRSDVFSLGVVLWELLAGRHLVDRGDVVEAMKVIRDGRWTPIAQAAPHTPPALAEAIAWAMAHKRDQRATAAELQVALEAYLKSAPDLATPTQLADWIRERFPRTSGAAALTDGPPTSATRAGRRTTPPPTSMPLGTAAARPGLRRPGTVPAEVTDAPAPLPAAVGTSQVAVTASAVLLEPVPPPVPRPPIRRTTPPPLPRGARAPTHLDEDDPNDPPTEARRPSEMQHVLPARRGVWIPLVVGLLAVAVAIAFAIVRAGGDGPASPATLAATGPDAATPVAIPLELPVDAGRAASDAPAPPPIDDAAPPAIDATLEIITRPRGATVKVSGHDPVTTPALLTMPTGPSTVVVTRDGYATLERKVELAAGEHRTLELTLERRPTAPARPTEVGYLTVRTNPYSVVMLGNRRLGETPFARVEVPAGTHVLTFVNPDRGSSKRTVLVRPGQTVKLSIQLP